MKHQLPADTWPSPAQSALVALAVRDRRRPAVPRRVRSSTVLLFLLLILPDPVSGQSSLNGDRVRTGSMQQAPPSFYQQPNTAPLIDNDPNGGERREAAMMLLRDRATALGNRLMALRSSGRQGGEANRIQTHLGSLYSDLSKMAAEHLRLTKSQFEAEIRRLSAEFSEVNREVLQLEGQHHKQVQKENQQEQAGRMLQALDQQQQRANDDVQQIRSEGERKREELRQSLERAKNQNNVSESERDDLQAKYNAVCQELELQERVDRMSQYRGKNSFQKHLEDVLNPLNEGNKNYRLAQTGAALQIVDGLAQTTVAAAAPPIVQKSYGLAKTVVDLGNSLNEGDAVNALLKDVQGPVKAGELANTKSGEQLSKDLGLPNGKALQDLSEAERKLITPQQLGQLKASEQAGGVLKTAGTGLKALSLGKNALAGETDKALVDAAGLANSTAGELAEGANKVRKGVLQVRNLERERAQLEEQSADQTKSAQRHEEEMLLKELAYQERVDAAKAICLPPQKPANTFVLPAKP